MMSNFSINWFVARFKQTILLYLILFLMMWLMYFLNATLFSGNWNRLGIHPRIVSIKSLVGVLFSWTMHVDINHLTNNSIVLSQILVVLGFLEKQVFRVVLFLILGSGFATWLLGAPYSNHVGASGLAFAMFGYMLSSAFLGKRWEYVIVCVLMGIGFWLTVFKGLLPKAGVSFAGHFGGLAAGVLIGIIYNRKRNI